MTEKSESKIILCLFLLIQVTLHQEGTKIPQDRIPGVSWEIPGVSWEILGVSWEIPAVSWTGSLSQTEAQPWDDAGKV